MEGIRVGKRVGVGAGEEFLLVVVAEPVVGSGMRGLEARVESCRFQAGAGLGVILIADILFPGLPTDGEPFEPSPDGLDEIPGIESVHQGLFAKGSALVRGFGVHEEAGAGFGGDDGGAADIVFGPGEGEEVEEGEEGHFDAEEEGGDADFDVGGGDPGGGFDGAARGQDGDGNLDGL